MKTVIAVGRINKALPDRRLRVHPDLMWERFFLHSLTHQRPSIPRWAPLPEETS